MAAFTNHLMFEFRAGIRNRQLLFLNYMFPLGFYALMGSIMPKLNPSFRPMIIPAMVVFATLSMTLIGLPEPLVTSRENGVFRNYKINGVPSASIVVIPALTTVLHLVIVSALIVLTAPRFFRAPLPANMLGFVLIFILMAFACAGIGALIGVVSPNARVSMIWSQVIFVPSMMLGGMTIPVSLLPETVQGVARLLPAAHAMNAFTRYAMGRPAAFDSGISILVLMMSGFLAFFLAIFLFSWDSHNSTRRGHPLLALLVLVPYFLSLMIA